MLRIYEFAHNLYGQKYKTTTTTTTELMALGPFQDAKKSFLHPSKTINDKYPNKRGDVNICDLLEIQREMKTVTRREQMCIVLMQHNDFLNIEVYAVKQWVKIITTATALFQEGSTTPREAPAAGGS